MNQPKFKFGDKVKSRVGQVFIVRAIMSHGDSFAYNENGEFDHTLWTEDFLELYQEPQKKKLFAFKLKPYGARWERVDFFTTDTHPDATFERAPDYDIEFDEAK